MRQFKTISLRRAIQSNLGKNRSEKYLKGLDKTDMVVLISPRMTDRENSNNIYQGTLTKLVEGNMEKAINYMVSGLDLDRDNKLLFSLCKNLVYSLNKQVEDNSEQLQRHRYSEDAEMNKNIIKLKIDELAKTIEKENNRLDKLEKELIESKPNFLSVNKFFITYQIKKKILKPQIKELKKSDNMNKEELIDLQSELKKVEKLLTLEEYLKILGLIMEVCIFPSRFETLI